LLKLSIGDDLIEVAIEILKSSNRNSAPERTAVYMGLALGSEDLVRLQASGILPSAERVDIYVSQSTT
jgi:hypothetical protein